MTRAYRFMGAVSITALIAMSSTSAMAAGAQAGSSITNTVQVDYKIGTVSQSQIQASDAFVVDRKIDVTIAKVEGTTISVSPGQAQAVTTFQVTNLSNDVADFALSLAAQQVGGTGAHSNTDTFDVSNVKIYVNATNDFSTATEINYIDELAADAVYYVFVAADIPLDDGGSPATNLISGDVAAVTLIADAHEGGVSGSLGDEYLNTNSDPNTTGVETVLADGTGVSGVETNYDGSFSAKHDYTVLAAALSVVKTSRLIDDPVNGTTDPKAIPGATVEYCIAVSNSGGATASEITVSDVLPDQVDFDSSFTALLDGTLGAGGVCNADGTPTAGAYNSGTNTVTGTLTDLASGNSATLIFRAILDDTTATSVITAP